MLLLLLISCGLGIRDGVTINVDGREPPGETLRVVVGGGLSLCLEPAHAWSRGLEAARLESADPSVLSAESGTCPSFLQAGASPGHTTLHVLEPAGIRQSIPVEVLLPDQVLLSPVGPKLLRSELPPAEPSPSLLSGGAALFLARPMYKGDELYGQGWATGRNAAWVHSTASPATLDTLSRDTVALWVDAGTPAGPRAAPLSVGGKQIDLPLRIHAPEEIATLSLTGPLWRNMIFVTYGFVLAEGRTASGELVHGLPVEWAFDEGWERRTGEVFRYTSQPGAHLTLQARWRGLGAKVEVEGRGGTVIDPPRQTCSAGREGGGWPIAGLLAAVIGIRRRRRRLPPS